MKLRYALLALFLAPVAAWAQTPNPDSTGTGSFTQPWYAQFDVLEPASIVAEISNFRTELLPVPPYTAPPATSLYLGGSVFYYVDAVTGDTISRGTSPTAAGVEGEVVFGLTAGGDLAFGCDGSPEFTSDIDNAADFAGKIVFLQRGPVAAGTTACGFFLKAQRAMDAGAVGIVIYNNPERDPDNAPNMSGGLEADPTITIPASSMPWTLTETFFNEYANGTTIRARMRCDTFYSNCPGASAGEGGPSAAGAGLYLTGPNPTSADARFQVRTPAAERVTVIAYNMLGQRVASLFEGAVLGQQEVTLTTTNLPAGSYFIRAVGETFTQTQQISVVR